MLEATASRIADVEQNIERALAGHNARLHILERERADINRTLVHLNASIDRLAPSVDMLRDMMSAWARVKDDGK